MADLKRIALVLMSCLLAFSITGCPMQVKPPRASQPVESTPAFSPDLPPEQYAPAIEKLQAVTPKPADPAAAENAHLQLAWLYASYKNPGRDYQKALDHIERYLSSQPADSGHYAARNLQALLATLATNTQHAVDSKQCAMKLKQLKTDIRTRNAASKRLQGQVTQLQAQMNQLALDNQTLKNKIVAMETNNQELASYNKSLLDKNKTLDETIETLEETIERLKRIEIQLERKRKSFK